MNPAARTCRLLCTKIAISLLLTTGAMAAQPTGPDEHDYDRILLAISPVPVVVPGAYGSLWKVTCVGRNDSDSPLIVIAFTPPVPGPYIGFPPEQQAAHSTFAVRSQTTDPNVGAFVFVSKGYLSSVSFSLRVQDTSRMSQTWGTSIPVIRADQTFSDTATISDVPPGPDFRNLLRVYDFDTPANRQVTVTIFDDEVSSTPLATEVLTLGASLPSNSVPHDEMPGHAMLDLGAVAPSAAHPLRIKIQSASPGLRFWGFVATTHNTTQFITLELPD